MKTPPEDHDLIRWLDGEMTPAERERFAARLEADAALKSEVEMMRRMSADLRAHLPLEMPVPHADFFNSQIQVRIAQEDARRPEPAPSRGFWLEWFRLPTLVAATAAIALAGVILWQNSSHEPAGNSIVLSTYAPNPNVQARSFHSDEAQATVLMLEGLEAVPSDRKIIGYHIERSETDQEMAATTLYGERGEVILVVTKDVRNQPRLVAAATPRS